MKSSNSKIHRITDTQVRSLVAAGEHLDSKGKRVDKPGWTNDGGSLYLKVTGPGAASWVFRYTKYDKEYGKNGLQRAPGLGAYPEISLAAAREKAAAMRKLRADGIDPLEHRESSRQQAELDKAKNITVAECAELWLAKQRKILNPRTALTYERQLRKYVSPLIGALPIKGIDETHILQVLNQIPPPLKKGKKTPLPAKSLWEEYTVTAHSVRSHLQEICDYARAKHYRDRTSENPARWGGNLEFSELAPIASIHTPQNRKSLPYAELPKFITVLQNWDKEPIVRRNGRMPGRGYTGRDGTIARCLHFMILTTTRPGEAAGARWCEIDWENRLWYIPAARMKEGRPHTVPLADQAIAILREQQEITTKGRALFTPLGKRIREAIEAYPDFGGPRISEIVGCGTAQVWIIRQALNSPGKPIGTHVFVRNTAPVVVQCMREYGTRAMGYGHIDVHGFRSSFSTWCNEERMLEYPKDLREFQLAHKVDNATAAAYQRGTGLTLRRRMMQDYANYCYGIVTPKVVDLDLYRESA